MKLTIKLICSVIAVLWATSSIATPNCEITETDRRFRSIQLTNGKAIFLLGYTHGDRALPFNLAKLVKSSVPNEIFLQKLNELIEGDYFAIKQVNENIKQIGQLIRDREDLKFIAVESTREAAKNSIDEYAMLSKEYRRVLNERGIELTPQLESLERAALGPAYSIALSGDEALTGVEVTGFESAEAVRQENEIGAAAEKLVAKLKKAAKEDRNFVGNLNGTDMLLWNMYDNFVPETDTNKILANIPKSQIPEAHRLETLRWIELLIGEMTTAKIREREVVRAIMDSKESGLLLIGDKHLNSIVQEIRAKCIESQLL